MTTTCPADAYPVGFIREVTFASCYVYSPTGSDPTSSRSRLLRSLLKDRDAAFLCRYARRVRHQASTAPPLAGFFPMGCVLVPVPGSMPGRSARASVARGLAAALLRQGVGGLMWTGLHRAYPVRKSATSPPGMRPTVMDHYASFTVDAFEVDPPPLRFVLVDDVVTKGRTLLAAAARLRESFPAADIRAFALVRTLGRVPEVRRLVDPCVGRIRWNSVDAVRTP